MVGPAESEEIIEYAIDEGINFFDTANTYSNGESEEIVGDVLSAYNRDRFVIATKVYRPMDPDNPNARGLSRKAIEQELANSLDRLGVNTIDLYQLHRWDDTTPPRETLSTLNDVKTRGHIRYFGGSSMRAFQFAELNHLCETYGYDPPVSMQNHYNLLYREEEREMLPFCAKEGIGVIPWSPLARGCLTRPHEEVERTVRGKTDEYVHDHPYFENGGREINDRVQELANEKGVTMAQIALAWLLHKEWVSAPIVGTRSKQHLKESIVASELSLSESEIDYLEKPYEPVRVSGLD